MRYLVVKAQKKNEAAFVQLMEMNKQDTRPLLYIYDFLHVPAVFTRLSQIIT